MNRSLILVSIVLFLLFSSAFVKAQGLPVGIGGLALTSSADNPNPGQRITLTVRSYSVDINASTITWMVDGKVVKKGDGLTTLDVTAPDLGKTINVTVLVSAPNEINLSSSITINSGSVDLILESDGYVPPYFRGKIPVVYQNRTKIIAVPHLADSRGVEYDPKNLIFQWKKNSRVVEDQSGYGKQVFILDGDIVPRTANINVTVTTKDGLKRAVGYISVPYTSPSLVFYSDSSLYGPLFNTAVGDNTFIGKEKETSVLAIPYGFTKLNSGIGNLSFSWFINGKENPDLSKNQSVTLRAPENSSGNSNIELTISNSKEILQSASAGFLVRFGSATPKPTPVVNP